MITRAKRGGVGIPGEYFERLAIYMIFVGCAVISIVVWIFNWVCWLKKYCCFRLFDDYSDKVCVWWLSFIFLCGVLACCIAGFVSANRLGFASYGVQCAYERIYYDTILGQLKVEFPKFKGLDYTKKFYEYLNNTINSEISLEQYNATLDNYIYPVTSSFKSALQTGSDQDKLIKEVKYSFFPAQSSLYNLKYSIDYLKNKKFSNNNIISYIESFYEGMSSFKSGFIKDFEYYMHVARGVGQILAIIFFAILLSLVTFAGSLLIIYYCNCLPCCTQESLIFPMHIIWNGIRFFIFCFFVYGCLYGMMFLAARDGIAYLQFIFSKENLQASPAVVIPDGTKNYFNYCLFTKSGQGLSDNLVNNLISDILVLESWKKTEISVDESSAIKLAFEAFKTSLTSTYDSFSNNNEELIEQIKEINYGTSDILSVLNCSFIENDLNLMYRALWDLSWESRILCALSCCIGFFGAIAVYSFLWTMELWSNNDSGYQFHQKIENNNYSNDNYAPPKIENKKSQKRKIRQIRPPKGVNNNHNIEMDDKKDDDDDGGSEES